MNLRSFLAKTFHVVAVAASVFILSSRLEAQEPQANNNKSVWDGVFSADQAQRGRISYNTKCASCHRPDLSGLEGVLRGPKFMEHWGEDSVDSLYSNIKRSMPRNEPGSLDSATYVDIISYILSQNGFPSGSEELKADDLKTIEIVPQEGAEALPSGALVQVYGCIKEHPANTWIVSTATKPIRTRNPDKSSDEDLKAAEAKPAGTATFQLIDAAFYHPERYKDHMVEAKGFLVTEPTPGISPTSISPLSSACQ